VLNNREVAVNLSVYPYRRKNRKNDRKLLVVPT
jgi:hypothetical protein